MDFKAALNDMVSNTDGAIGAGLVGLDGMLIDQVSTKVDFDITVAGAEYATIIKNALKASENFGLGKTGEIMISTDTSSMVMVLVGDQYFVALALALDGNLGRARLELKKLVPKFVAALT